jgi:sialic acid synthase SpsE
MKLAKELIRVATESGADLIKGIAFKPQDFRMGKMPLEFYAKCALTEPQYLELIYYARDLNTDMFFSIFSEGFNRIRREQEWRKFSSSQTVAGQFSAEHDNPFSVVSVPKAMIDSRSTPKIRRAWPLFATDYMPKDPELEYLEALRGQVNGHVGLSDHTIGPDTALRAIKWHNVNCIEKHFTLEREVTWSGFVVTDTLHGATPRELEQIANGLH